MVLVTWKRVAFPLKRNNAQPSPQNATTREVFVAGAGFDEGDGTHRRPVIVTSTPLVQINHGRR